MISPNSNGAPPTCVSCTKTVRDSVGLCGTVGLCELTYCSLRADDPLSDCVGHSDSQQTVAQTVRERAAVDVLLSELTYNSLPG